MASNTRPSWMTFRVATGFTLLLASVHISPVAGYAPQQSVTSHITSGRATSLPGLFPRSAYPGGLPATLSTSILPREEEVENGTKDDGDEAKPAENVPAQNDVQDSDSDRPNTCGSEKAEIEKLNQDIAHCNLFQKPQCDQAIELLTAERDDLLKKLEWMTHERDREHKSFVSEFTAGMERNAALIAAQRDALVAKEELELCKFGADKQKMCPQERCCFFVCT